MKVWDQKEEELPTPAINYTVMQNSFLTEVENVEVLIESLRRLFLNMIESPQNTFSITVC